MCRRWRTCFLVRVFAYGTCNLGEKVVVKRALCKRENGGLVGGDNDAYEGRVLAKSSAYFFAFSSSPSFRYISYTFPPST